MYGYIYIYGIYNIQFFEWSLMCPKRGSPINFTSLPWICPQEFSGGNGFSPDGGCHSTLSSGSFIPIIRYPNWTPDWDQPIQGWDFKGRSYIATDILGVGALQLVLQFFGLRCETPGILGNLSSALDFLSPGGTTQCETTPCYPWSSWSRFVKLWGWHDHGHTARRGDSKDRACAAVGLKEDQVSLWRGLRPAPWTLESHRSFVIILKTQMASFGIIVFFSVRSPQVSS